MSSLDNDDTQKANAKPGLEQLNIIVVGGSQSGLMSAIALKRLGHNVKIFERSPTSQLAQRGAGLGAGDDLVEFVRIYDETKTPICIICSLEQRIAKDGSVQISKCIRHHTSWDLLYNILRANFDGGCEVIPAPESVLKNPGVYLLNHNVISFSYDDTKSSDCVEVIFETSKGNQQRAYADILIAADGASATSRSILEPQVRRKYVGYILWRGVIPETKVSEEIYKCLVEPITFFHIESNLFISYIIPGNDGSMEKGKRKFNWGWYWNLTEEELKDVLKDEDGKAYTFSIPPGKVRKELWHKQQEIAKQLLPPQLIELTQLTENPFIQVITDVCSPRAVYNSGHTVIVGDALCSPRPHTGSGVNQAAKNALKLSEVFSSATNLNDLREKISKDYNQAAVEYATQLFDYGKHMGENSLFGKKPK